jgi:hypothetical protein
MINIWLLLDICVKYPLNTPQPETFSKYWNDDIIIECNKNKNKVIDGL